MVFRFPIWGWRRRLREAMNRGIKSSSMNSNPLLSLPELPQDIISDILTRLPVKILVKYKCVCKAWFYLISNPKFIKAHLEKSSVSNTKQRLLLCYTDQEVLSDYNYLVRSCPLDFHDADILDFPSSKPIRCVSIVGSCHGVVCLDMGDFGIILWNPVTRKSKELLVPGKMYGYGFIDCYGFGYDHTNDDYKVVRIATYDAEGNKGKRDVQVYSLKTDSWRRIRDFPYDSPCLGGNYVNGVLYWMIRPVGVEEYLPSRVIVFLDLGNETYGEIPQPVYDEDLVFYSSLCVIEGCLSMSCYINDHRRETTCIEQWVMKGYGIGDTWIKLYTITDPDYDYSPLCISLTGEILLSSGCYLNLYNPSTGEIRDHMIGKVSMPLLYLLAITYVESLVSPDLMMW